MLIRLLCRYYRQYRKPMTNELISGNDRGMVLIAALLMLAAFISVFLICAYALQYESDEDIRYQISHQRMEEMKYALFGVLHKVPGGVGLRYYGGVMSDYGPFAMDGLSLICKKPGGAKAWHYERWASDQYGNEVEVNFWAGYRGERYYIPPPGEHDPNLGWGIPPLTLILGCKIFYDTGCYGKDKSDYRYLNRRMYYYRIRDFWVAVTNKTSQKVYLKIQVVLPLNGEVAVATMAAEGIDEGSLHTFMFSENDLRHSHSRAPATFTPGMRKLIITEYDSNGNLINRRHEVFTIPILPPVGYFLQQSYTLEVDYEG